MIIEMLSTDGFPLLIPLCIFYPQFLYRWPHGKWQLIWWNVLHIRTFMQAVFCDMCNKVLLRYLILFFFFLNFFQLQTWHNVLMWLSWECSGVCNAWPMCDSLRDDAAETELQPWQHNPVHYLYIGGAHIAQCINHMYVYTAAAKIIRTHHI